MALDSLGRGTLLALEKHRSESKADYLERLGKLADEGKLAEVTAQLLNSEDDRVRARVLDFVGKVKGWFGPGAVGGDVHHHHGDEIHVGVTIEAAPPDRAGFLAEVVKAVESAEPPALEESNGHEGSNGNA